MGDSGLFMIKKNLLAHISDTKAYNGVYVHFVSNLCSNLQCGREYNLIIDTSRREKLEITTLQLITTSTKNGC